MVDGAVPFRLHGSLPECGQEGTSVGEGPLCLRWTRMGFRRFTASRWSQVGCRPVRPEEGETSPSVTRRQKRLDVG